mgnify:CR=1 FL=1
MKDKEPVKILYITQEINPYIKETEIADICRQFPQYTIDKGCEIRTFMPCFGHINERRNQLHEVQRLSGLNVIIDDREKVTMGAKIKDAKVLGTPYITVIGDRQEGDNIELEDSKTGKVKTVKLEELIEIIK